MKKILKRIFLIWSVQVVLLANLIPGGIGSRNESVLYEEQIDSDGILQDRLNLVGWSMATYNNNQYVAYYNSSLQVVMAKRSLDPTTGLPTSRFSENTVVHTGKTVASATDDHRFITIGFDGAGFLWCGYASHAESMTTGRGVFRMNAAESIATAQANETAFSGIASTAFDEFTYPVFWRNPLNSDEMYFMFRDGSSGDGVERLLLYTASNTTWVAAPGTFTSAGQFQLNTRSGGTDSIYICPPFITSDGVCHFTYMFRIDSGAATNNSDVCYLAYDMVNGEFRKSDGTVYTNTLQFDSGTSTRSQDKVVDIPTNSNLESDYIQRRIAVDDQSNIYMVYAANDSNSFRNVHIVKYDNSSSSWGSPLQLTHYRSANNGFVNPQLYMYNNALYVLFTPADQPSILACRVSRDRAATWSQPFAISYGGGHFTGQNMDYDTWKNKGVFYAVKQLIGNDDTIAEEERSVSIFTWRPSDNKSLPIINLGELYPDGDLFLGSRNGNVIIAPATQEVLKIRSKLHTSTILDHNPDEVTSASVRNIVVRTTNDNITPTSHFVLDIEQPTSTGGSGGLPTNMFLFTVDAAAGTHKLVDAGTTKTTPGTVNAWVKIDVNGTIHYIPCYTSKTS